MFDLDMLSIWHCGTGACQQNGYVNITFTQPILMEYVRVFGRSCCFDDCHCHDRYKDICLYVDRKLGQDKYKLKIT